MKVHVFSDREQIRFVGGSVAHRIYCPWPHATCPVFMHDGGRQIPIEFNCDPFCVTMKKFTTYRLNAFMTAMLEAFLSESDRIIS